MHALVLALLEDDDNSNQVSDSLKRFGHEVVTSKNFGDAIEILKSRHVDLIVSDVHLENGGNVFDFLRWVRSNMFTKDVPFVMFSSKPTSAAKHFEDGVRTSARILGAQMFISMEAFEAGDFCEQIDSLLKARHQKSKLDINTKG